MSDKRTAAPGGPGESIRDGIGRPEARPGKELSVTRSGMGGGRGAPARDGTGISPRVRAAVVAAVLVAACLAVFRTLPGSQFIEFDDPVYVTGNRVVREGITARGLAWAFTSFEAANWHPLTWLSHQLDVTLFGLAPGGHHLTSLLLHAIAAVSLFLVLRRMTGMVWPGAVTAMLFAVHPLHVESVAWVAERKDVLSACLWMLTLACWLAYVRRPGPGRYLPVAACLALGLMAKPMLVTLPAVLLLLDFWPLGRMIGPGAGGRSRHNPGAALRLAAEKLPLLALSAASSVLTVMAQSRGGAVTRLTVLPIGTRLVNAVLAYGWYLAKAVWPSRLAVIYPYDAASRTAGDPALLAAAAVLLGASLASVLLMRRRPFLFTGWFWFLGTLVPVIGVVQVGLQAFADRYSYLPLVGVFLAAVWGLLGPSGPRWRAAMLLPAALVLALLGGRAGVQAGYWKDNLALFTRALEISPGSWQAHQMVAISLKKKGDGPGAIRHLQQVLEIVPAMSEAHTNLGKTYADLGMPAEAIGEYEAALRAWPEDALTRFLLAELLYRQGNLESSLVQYRELLRHDPGNARAEHNLGYVLDDLGRVGEAVGHYRAALRLDPDVADAHLNLGVALVRLNRLGEAAAEFRATLALDPGNATAESNLRRVAEMQGGQ